MPSPKSASPKSKSKSGSAAAEAPAAAAGAGASAAAGAGAGNARKTYAIGNPKKSNLIKIRSHKQIPPQIMGYYRFYRESDTTPNWIYFTDFGDNLTEEIVGVYNTVTSKEYTIHKGLIYPSSEGFGFKNTRLKNQGGGQKTRRRHKTRRS